MQWGDQYLGYMSGNAEAEFRIEPKSTGVSPARINVSSGGPLEAAIGYSRAVRLGDHIAVAGTTTLRPQGIDHPGDCYLQTRAVLEIVEDTLQQVGATLSDVVRTRAFITDISVADA